jgi:LDH2 family malate/lactate/ureidoglycolate dehydrogenase
MDRGEGFLAPLGGTAWYKGFGLALWCELLCAGLAGAAAAPIAAAAGHVANDLNVGLVFAAMRPEALSSSRTFQADVEKVLSAVLSLSKGNAAYPGYGEAQTAAHRTTNGIPITQATRRDLETLEEELNIAL